MVVDEKKISSSPVTEYRYSMSKNSALGCMIVFSLFGLGLLIIALAVQTLIPTVLTIFSFFMVWLGHTGYHSNRKIKIYEDRIEIPRGHIFTNKSHTVFFDEISRIEEVAKNFSPGNYHPGIKVYREGKTVLTILVVHLSEEDYDEIFDQLEKVVKPKGAEFLPPIEAEKKAQKAKKIKYIAFGIMPLPLIATRYFSGNLNSFADWMNMALVLGVIYSLSLLEFLGSSQAAKSKQSDQFKKSRADVRRSVKKWNLMVYCPGIICILALFLLMKLPRGGSTSIWEFIVYGLSFSLAFFMLLNPFLPKVENNLSSVEKWTAYITSGFMIGIFFVMACIVSNQYFDKSHAQPMESFLTDQWTPSGGKNHLCYRIAHWKTREPIRVGDKAHCTYEYPRISLNDKVLFDLHQGFLGVPWMANIQLVKLSSPKNMIKAFQGELGLRGVDIHKLASIHGKDIWENYGPKWKDLCFGESPGHCRLAAYIASLKPKSDKVKEFLDYGCQKGDFFTCYNLYSLSTIKEKEKKMAFEKMKDHCGNGDLGRQEKEVCEYLDNQN